MATVQIDLTKPLVLPGGSRYRFTIIKADIKTPDGKNDKGEDKSPYINFQLHEEGGYDLNVFHIVSFKSPWALKAMAEAADIPFDANGFDTNDFIGKQIEADVTLVDDPQYGLQNKVGKVYKV